MKNTACKYGLVRRSTATGEVTMVLAGMDRSALHVWALRNSERQEVIIFEIDSGLILGRYTDQGTDDGYPRVEYLAAYGEYIDESVKRLILSGADEK